MPCPYIVHDPENAVHMVGHNDKFIQCGVGKMVRNGLPTSQGRFTPFVQLHHPVQDSTKQMCSILRAEGNEIRSRPGVIPSGQSNRSAMVAFLTKRLFHTPIADLLLFPKRWFSLYSLGIICFPSSLLSLLVSEGTGSCLDRRQDRYLVACSRPQVLEPSGCRQDAGLHGTDRLVVSSIGLL